MDKNKKGANRQPTRFLVVVALLGSFVGGFFLLTDTIVGVGILFNSCLVAILATMCQAHNHHSELMAKLDRQAEKEGEA